VRASTLINHVADLAGVQVRLRSVMAGSVVVVTVAARRGVLACLLCEFATGDV
jgi:hypothetical protein